MNSSAVRFLTMSLLMMAAASAADAHATVGVIGGFESGFLHPILGWDHVVAMVAVGLWGAFLGRPAIYLLPIIFPVVMSVGGAFGVVGGPMPGIEIGIDVSGIVLGLVVALGARPPIWVAGVIVGIFGFFHGYAHGAELPEAANPFAYAVGFVIATGLLHLTGIALGFLTLLPKGQYVVRAAGVGISAVGAAFLLGYA